MFSVLKFIWIVFKAFPALLNVDRNALAHVPSPTKYLAMILLICFWCLAFGLYMGEPLSVGYNMLGHVAIFTMVFVSLYVLRSLNHTNARGADYLRMPDYSSRCDEMTDEQRRASAARADALLNQRV